ncbi:uncharacterized protein LOC110845759 [Folsomia candida]|uniref:uncharacterized protein LOC110845742 n=1 Tax=Folsomia candida TaxID=158441 RepID=UPI000B8F2408|nr:uncharacterized protein LOC110845742 [Folsomia candida]XP_021947949.1 uncharacterized protein LOC110845759 [Folsomia candida]
MWLNFYLKSFHVSFFLALVFTQTVADSSSEEEFSFSSAWETFWSVSCEFSDLVVRSKRSVHLDEPDFGDPLELFNYLYPLADVKLEEVTASEERSAHSLTTWVEDLVDLWEAECHSRSRNGREKRDAPNPINRKKDEMSSPYRSVDDDHEEDDDGYTYENAGDANATSTTTAPPAAAGKKEKKVIADADTFFTQYGGDIEYFFPLIAFGIPFDGEITFLGFHGFKGLFPYK